MNDETNNPNNEGAANSTVSGGTIAENFVADELEKARKSLMTTRIVVGGLTLFVLAYMSFLTWRILEFSDPKNAAEAANGMLSEYADQYTAQILGEINNRIPEFIAPLPDRLIENLPKYRARLEDDAIARLRVVSGEVSAEMDDQLTTYLAVYEEEIKELLAAGEDPEALKELAVEIVGELKRYMNRPDENGESILYKIEVSQLALSQVNEHVNRLANASDLSDHEKKQRRVIAIVARTVDASL